MKNTINAKVKSVTKITNPNPYPEAVAKFNELENSIMLLITPIAILIQSKIKALETLSGLFFICIMRLLKSQVI